MFARSSPLRSLAQALYRKLSIHGQSLKLWWAKSKQADGDGGRLGPGGAGTPGGSGAAARPPQPPSLPGAQMQAGQLRSLYPSMNPNAMGARPDL